MITKTKLITLCGSSRFVEIMAVISWFIETRESAIVFGIHLLPSWYTEIKDHLAEQEGVVDNLAKLHRKKIDISDEIFVVDFDNYIGESTKSEIEYAKSIGLRVRYLTCEPELYGEILRYDRTI